MVCQHQFYYPRSMQQTNLLKFVVRGRTEPSNKGIRTFPHHTYGVSRQSPDYFHQTHTIINTNTYNYEHQNAPQFEYHSQKKTPMPGVSPSAQIPPPCHLHHPNNPYRFHLKKGRLGEFTDKNGWMKTAYVMSGGERSGRAREVNNRDRSLRISNLKERMDYDSNIIVKPKIHESYYRTLQDIMSEKLRIRARRNKEAERRTPLRQRAISELKPAGSYERDNVISTMSKTTQEWHCASKERRGRELSMRGNIGRVDEFEVKEGDLESWQRRTQNSKWCFKTGRQESQQNEEQGISQLK